MPAERYFIDQDFEIGKTAALNATETHHLIHVMRTRENESIELVNGRGQIAEARVIKMTKNAVQLAILSTQELKKEPIRSILVQAIPRLNRLETIIEKCTELGVSEIWLIPGDLSEKKELSEHQKTRIDNIAIAAMKQCGRAILPKILYKQGLKHWKPLENDPVAFFGDVNPAASLLRKELEKLDFTKEIFFFVGPEAGFSMQEEEKLTQLGVKGVKLHHNILRTDTAPIVALSLIHSR